MNVIKVCMTMNIILSIMDAAFFSCNSEKIILKDIIIILLALDIINYETKGTGGEK